ncbi:retrovirus-related pol polyprotein from transposon TNT 1-94 [Tanacetum coccineum]
MNSNIINDLLHIASSDHPGMILTNTPFNGSNFHGWSRNIKMALGAKLKLGFIDGSCVKPATASDDLQRWIRCDYMVTCWILNSMVTELSDAFLYAQSANSNSKLIQFLMKLNDEYESVRSQILAMDPLPTVNKAYYIVQQIEKQKQVTNHSFEPIAFFANINNKSNNSGRKDNRGNRNENRGETSRNDTSYKKICTGCGQEGYLFEQCFERIGYPDWYKGKKGKKNSRMAAHVNSRFDEHFNRETPFDMGYENEVGMSQHGNVDQKLVAVVCQEMMKLFKNKGVMEEKGFAGSSHAVILSLFTASFALFCHHDMDLFLDWVSDTGASNHMSKTVTIVGQVQLTPSLILTDVFYDLTTKQIIAVGKGSQCLYICKPTLDQATFDAQVSSFCKTYQNVISFPCVNKSAFSNSATKHSVDIKTFHERLAHTSVSKLVYIPQCKGLDVSSFSCECCLLAKHHRLPFQRSNSIATHAFDLIHVDLWGLYKHVAQNGAHYFFTIVDDHTRAT